MKKTLLGAFGALLMLSACASDATRCEAFKEVFKQNEVLFATGKAELTPASKEVLDKQIDWLKANPDSNYDLPQDVIDKTIAKYLEAYELLTGKKL